jgi:hypothetical protein
VTRATTIPRPSPCTCPFRVVKRGGRKEMVLPEGAAQPCRTDSTLVRYVTPLLQFTNRPYRLWLMRVDAADPYLIAQLYWIVDRTSEHCPVQKNRRHVRRTVV